ncbi:MAG: hypothetical protein EBS32_03330 [Actinobacteria bacterium]|nr:hypothetical protein [Actinomycetota bacterium]
MRAESDIHLNLAVVVGEVARDATRVDMGDGRVFTNFDLVSREGGVRTVVPVTYEGEMEIAAGELAAVSGHVNKRFFASGSGMASRTDVRADKVTIVRRRDQVSRFMAGVLKGLGSR